MTITGTHFNYYQLCHRKLWLFANGINMEQESDLVYEGKLVHESSYPQRTSKYEEVEIDGIRVDYYDTKNKVMPRESLLSGKALLAQTSAYLNKKKRVELARKFIQGAAWNMVMNLNYYI